uniref:Chitin-binding type-2 domain-containing protein n=1 Tax=Bracon brevicornis TaxID=1563983 RepID=A0A6V7KNI1_9HYME
MRKIIMLNTFPQNVTPHGQVKTYAHPHLGTTEIRHCTHNQFYDDHEGRCLVVPGGGTATYIDPSRTCERDVMRPNLSDRRRYFVCRSSKIIYAECDEKQTFSNRLKRCIPDDSASEPEDKAHTHYHDELPSCERAGKYPSPENCHVFYTCASNGFRMFKDIHSCPRGTGYDQDKEICSENAPCLGTASTLTGTLEVTTQVPRIQNGSPNPVDYTTGFHEGTTVSSVLRSASEGLEQNGTTEVPSAVTEPALDSRNKDRTLLTTRPYETTTVSSLEDRSSSKPISENLAGNETYRSEGLKQKGRTGVPNVHSNGSSSDSIIGDVDKTLVTTQPYELTTATLDLTPRSKSEGSGDQELIGTTIVPDDRYEVTTSVTVGNDSPGDLVTEPSEVTTLSSSGLSSVDESLKSPASEDLQQYGTTMSSSDLLSSDRSNFATTPFTSDSSTVEPDELLPEATIGSVDDPQFTTTIPYTITKLDNLEEQTSTEPNTSDLPMNSITTPIPLDSWTTGKDVRLPQATTEWESNDDSSDDQFTTPAIGNDEKITKSPLLDLLVPRTTEPFTNADAETTEDPGVQLKTFTEETNLDVTTEPDDLSDSQTEPTSVNGTVTERSKIQNEELPILTTEEPADSDDNLTTASYGGTTTLDSLLDDDDKYKSSTDSYEDSSVSSYDAVTTEPTDTEDERGEDTTETLVVLGEDGLELTTEKVLEHLTPGSVIEEATSGFEDVTTPQI